VNDERQEVDAEGALAEAARCVVHPDHSRQSEPEPHPDTSLEDASLRRRYSWAELFKRVFLDDVLVCGHCGGRRKVLSFILSTEVILKILSHLGLPTEPPSVHPARASPEQGSIDF
jgi:hypothetical protein